MRDLVSRDERRRKGTSCTHVRYSLRMAGIVVNGPQVSETMAGERGQLRKEKVGRRCDKPPRTYGDSRANSTLTFLDTKVRKQDTEDVLGSNGLGNVAKGVDGRSADTLLVSLEEVEELKADAHPLAGGDELGTAIGLKEGRISYKRTKSRIESERSPMRPIRLIDASWTFSCLFRRIGVMRGTEGGGGRE